MYKKAKETGKIEHFEAPLDWPALQREEKRTKNCIWRNFHLKIKKKLLFEIKVVLFFANSAMFP